MPMKPESKRQDPVKVSDVEEPKTLPKNLVVFVARMLLRAHHFNRQGWKSEIPRWNLFQTSIQ